MLPRNKCSERESWRSRANRAENSSISPQHHPHNTQGRKSVHTCRPQKRFCIWQKQIWCLLKILLEDTRKHSLQNSLLNMSLKSFMVENLSMFPASVFLFRGLVLRDMRFILPDTLALWKTIYLFMFDLILKIFIPITKQMFNSFTTPTPGRFLPRLPKELV